MFKVNDTVTRVSQLDGEMWKRKLDETGFTNDDVFGVTEVYQDGTKIRLAGFDQEDGFLASKFAAVEDAPVAGEDTDGDSTACHCTEVPAAVGEAIKNVIEAGDRAEMVADLLEAIAALIRP